MRSSRLNLLARPPPSTRRSSGPAASGSGENVFCGVALRYGRATSLPLPSSYLAPPSVNPTFPSPVWIAPTVRPGYSQTIGNSLSQNGLDASTDCAGTSTNSTRHGKPKARSLDRISTLDHFTQPIADIEGTIARLARGLVDRCRELSTLITALTAEITLVGGISRWGWAAGPRDWRCCAAAARQRSGTVVGCGPAAPRSSW